MKLPQTFIGLLLLTAVGCASQPAEIAPQATQALTSLRDQLFSAKAQVQEATNAAEDLVNQPRADLTAQIQRLNSAVTALNSTRAAARAEAQAYDEKTEKYFAQWDASLKSMSAETAERGEKRLALAKKSIDTLNRRAAEIRSDLNPFMAELNEANKYLLTDTTKSGLQVVRPKLLSAMRRSPEIVRTMDATIADIDAIRAGK
jgi:SMC interacting uncharacterized protein involved in chromosome segregation